MLLRAKVHRRINGSELPYNNFLPLLFSPDIKTCDLAVLDYIEV
jgi:hypothetical protein